MTQTLYARINKRKKIEGQKEKLLILTLLMDGSKKYPHSSKEHI
jgi:hypothetical protein